MIFDPSRRHDHATHKELLAAQEALAHELTDEQRDLAASLYFETTLSIPDCIMAARAILPEEGR